jgi:uncharacterized protein
MCVQYAAVVAELFDIAGDDAVVLRVHVQPGAGRTAVVGRHGDAVKVRVAAPPEGGRANDACVALLAEVFGLPEASVTLSGGPKSRHKRFRLEGVDLDEFSTLLERTLDAGAAAGQGPRNKPTDPHGTNR